MKIRRTHTLLLGLTAVIFVAGCATTPTSTQTPASTPAPAKPVFGKGGYYLDDGPDDNPPPNLLAMPDAVPKDEPLHRFANRPYEVLGSRYTPETSNTPYKQQGIASWYGRKFNGKKTASGESYDMYSMTAAHRTLPIPSYVRVTNPQNNRSVVLRVNDRGPFHPDRLIDLSYTAALKLGLIGTGSGTVQIERVFADNSIAATKFAKTVPPSTEPLAPTPSNEPEVAASTTSNTRELFVQLGAFGTLDSAESFRDKTRQDLTWITEGIQIISKGGLYRVRLGPYASRTEATAIAAKVRQTLDFTPHIAAQ